MVHHRGQKVKLLKALLVQSSADVIGELAAISLIYLNWLKSLLYGIDDGVKIA